MNKEIPKRIQQLLNAKVKQCVRIARKHYDKNNNEIDPPIIKISSRLRSTGGLADFTTYEITLNKWMLIHYGKKYIDWIIPHEYAHIIATDVYNPQEEHGKLWKKICITLGGTGETGHSFDYIPTKTNVHVYKCKCDSYNLSNSQHKKFKRFRIPRVCTKCNTQLTHVRTYAKRSTRNTNWFKL